MFCTHVQGRQVRRSGRAPPDASHDHEGVGVMGGIVSIDFDIAMQGVLYGRFQHERRI